MTLFADTNWLVAAYFIRQEASRTAIVERFTRKHGAPWVVSQVVLLEARNVFGWVSRTTMPAEWERLESDLGGRIFVDTMQWDMVRQKTLELFGRYSHKAAVGSFEAVLVASALLTGATHFLSFDGRAKSLAAAERLAVYPELTPAEKALLLKLR